MSTASSLTATTAAFVKLDGISDNIRYISLTFNWNLTTSAWPTATAATLAGDDGNDVIVSPGADTFTATHAAALAAAHWDPRPTLGFFFDITNRMAFPFRTIQSRYYV